MALVQFKYGNGALPSIKDAGALYVNQYNKKIYVDLDESNRVCVGDFQRVDWTSSNTITSPVQALEALTVKDNNVLYLTYDLKTGYSALWYYDNYNEKARFREIISSESIHIIASEFDRINGEITSLETGLENLTGVVDTKVSKTELASYRYVTQEEAAAFAVTAISNVQGDAVNDIASTLTIQGTRKYVSAINTSLEAKISTNSEKLLALEGTLQAVSNKANSADTIAREARESANKANSDLIEVKKTLQRVDKTASDAQSLAATADGKADDLYDILSWRDWK